LKHAEDLFGGLSVANTKTKPVTAKTASGDAVELSTLDLFKPGNKESFDTLRKTLATLLAPAAKKPLYTSFLQDLVADLTKEMSSEQVKKTATRLTAISNEKLKEEKAADKGGKKSKAQKTKTTLATGKDVFGADTRNYTEEYGLEEDDFM
jgi:translation initiation factor 3 subunit J